MLNLTRKRKNRYIREQKNEIEARLVNKNRMPPQEREELRKKKQRIKDKFETQNMGDFQALYPLKRGLRAEDDQLMDKYDRMNAKAKQLYED